MVNEMPGLGLLHYLEILDVKAGVVTPVLSEWDEARRARDTMFTENEAHTRKKRMIQGGFPVAFDVFSILHSRIVFSDSICS